MRCAQTEFDGLLVLTPKVFRDARGFFLETWSEPVFSGLGIEARFVQDNHARSEQAGVVRGLHFQAPPHAQAKLVWVTRGAVFDVAVDLRAASPTYGKWFGCRLDEDNFMRLYIPRGFAHGYMTLEPGTEFQYKVDAPYAPQADGGLRWNDPDLAVAWPDMSPILSLKDQALPLWREFQTPFR